MTQVLPLVPKLLQTSRQENANPQALSRAAGIRNLFTVPTARSLDHSIVVVAKTVWDLYEAIEFCSNQGEDLRSHTILGRRKNTHPHQDENLFIVKQYQYTSNDEIRNFTKPRSQFLVELHSAFCAGTHFWMLYEEMDLSLEQVLALDCDPWTVNPGQKMNQIAAIASQVPLPTSVHSHI